MTKLLLTLSLALMTGVQTQAQPKPTGNSTGGGTGYQLPNGKIEMGEYFLLRLDGREHALGEDYEVDPSWPIDQQMALTIAELKEFVTNNTKQKVTVFAGHLLKYLDSFLQEYQVRDSIFGTQSDAGGGLKVCQK